MGDNKSNFIQQVFDVISLEKNMELWMSSDDNLLQDRLELLSSHPETLFQDHLFCQRTNLSKNPTLSKGFKSKAEKMEDCKQALHLFNMSLMLATSEEESEIILKRAEILDKLDYVENSQDSKNSYQLGFQNCIDIKETQLQGRFTIANRDIEAGELIAVDQPVAKLLDKEHTKSHCWNCLRSTKSLPILACKMCSGVLYCKEECRKIAQETYHRYECGITDVLYKSDVGVWILAYRTVASYPKETFLENQHKEDPLLNDYTKLVAHYGSDKYSAPELMKEALICIFFTRCLQATGYFGPKENIQPELNTEELQIALWIHRFMRISRFNCHAVREVSMKTNDSVETCSIGAAINPTLAMINHSCDSNYGRVWNLEANQVLAFATRPIKKGEEVTDGYSGIFSNVPYQERTSIHSKYHFSCLCLACEQKWPMKNKLGSQLPSNSKKDKKLAKFKFLLKQKDKKDLKAQEKFDILKEAVSLAYQILKSPHLVICNLENQLYNQLRILH